MKKYLEDLEKELKKMKLNDQEIKEILSDYVEMLDEATKDGLSDDELVEKFGNPDDIAKQLYKDSLNESFEQTEKVVVEEGIFKDYELFKAFPVVSDVKKLQIKLINEDIICIPHDGESIEVYAKKLKHPDNYEITYVDNSFSLTRKKQSGFVLFGSRSGDVSFGVKIPQNVNFEDFMVGLVSGDGELFDIKTEKMSINTTSGDMQLNDIKSNSLIKLSVVSGDIDVENLEADELEISLVSGDVKIKNANVKNEVYSHSVSGDVEVHNLKAFNLDFKAVSGDFEGKEVYVEEVKVNTVSGDFEIRNSVHDHEIVVTKKKTLSGDVTIK